MTKSVSECTLDLFELDRLLNLAQRSISKDLLTAEKTRVEGIINELKAKESEKVSAKPKALPTFTEKSYAWDQSSKFIKIYLSLKGIQNIPVENIKLSTNNGQYSVFVSDLNGKNHQFFAPKLLHEVSTFSFKVKQDSLLLMMKKVKEEKWAFLSEREKVDKDDKDKVPSMDKNEDPSASIMNLMKKMYSEGDDDMKRTIAKAWTEARGKNESGLP